MLPIHDVQFGELDARNEVFQQQRNGFAVFYNSFQVPPSVDLQSLLNGARYFVHGQKGSGKTALIWYLKRQLELSNAKCDVVLFKSDLTEVERQKISTLLDTSIFSDQGKISPQYDYKMNWLWFIMRSIVRMIDPKDVLDGQKYVADLKEVTGSNKGPRQSIFSGLQFTKIQSSISAALKAGVFSSDLKGDIEGVFGGGRQELTEVISACERALCSIVFRPDAKFCLFFDELELFLQKEDQRDRDLFLIRDLLYAVSRINRALGPENHAIFVYASVRSEVLHEVNRVGPEIRREVSDFGASVAWDVKSSSPIQPILRIVEAKVNASELEHGLDETPDVWSTYFPAKAFGKSFTQYLLDISMFRPRNIVRRLRLAQQIRSNESAISQHDLDASSTQFSIDVWSEMEEDLLSVYAPVEVEAIKALLSGYRNTFTLEDFADRISVMSTKSSSVARLVSARVSAERIVSDLYRVGALGNIFEVVERGKMQPRDRWVFRSYPEPLLDKRFLVHESLRKVFQLAF